MTTPTAPYSAVAADLRRRAQELNDAADNLDWLANNNGSAPAAAPEKRPVRKRPTASAALAGEGARRGLQPSAETLRKARRQFEAGERVVLIAKEAGVTDTSIYTYAKRDGWKRKVTPERKKGAGRTSVTATRRCEDCGGATNEDPCEHCRRPMP